MTDLLNTTCSIAQRGTLRLFSDWSVHGEENVPPMGPLIVVANHVSNFDPPLVSASFPRRIWFLAKKELFKGPGKWFFTTYGAHPVNRSATDPKAYRWALEKLATDQCVMIFPEGTRSRTGAMKKAQPGVVRLAMKSQAAIVPVGITGTNGKNSPLHVFRPSGRLRINIGRAFTLPDIEGRPSAAVLQSMTDMIMERVAMLLPSEYQGVYGADADDGEPQGRQVETVSVASEGTQN
ncbi:MAG: 1-acyl-sn-glycerol-3-phosphate acyltransferase [Dehalococcoidia bacterium]|nr:1-acyl-sn-glycerol-3-phosphate acyltransferase [Dehalococcoidia bacterium]